jgi:hypothetical protein
MTNPFEQVLKDTIKTSKSHLPFPEACAFYGALRCDVPPAVVASVAGVSLVTVSYLTNAGQFRSGHMRYRKVAGEYEALGHAAFVEKYLTPAIRERCLTALENFKRGLLPQRQSNFVRARSNGLVGIHILKPRNEWQSHTARVQIEATPDGYRWALLAIGTVTYSHEHAPKSEPFATSREAFLAARSKFTPTEEELDQIKS